MGLVYEDKVDAAVGTIFYLKGNLFCLTFYLENSDSGSSVYFRASRSYSKHLLNLCCAKVKGLKKIIKHITLIVTLNCFLRGRTQPRWTAIIRPFTLDVWISIALVFLVVTVITASFLVVEANIVSISSVLNNVTSFLIPIMLNQDTTKTFNNKIRNYLLSKARFDFQTESLNLKSTFLVLALSCFSGLSIQCSSLCSTRA